MTFGLARTVRVKGMLAQPDPGFYKPARHGCALHADPARARRDKSAAVPLRPCVQRRCRRIMTAWACPAPLFETHIAYDIGAAHVTRALADAYGAAALLGGVSRLLIDLNRGADDPTLVMKLSDGSIIPGNRDADAEEVARRLSAVPCALSRRHPRADRTHRTPPRS